MDEPCALNHDIRRIKRQREPFRGHFRCGPGLRFERIVDQLPLRETLAQARSRLKLDIRAVI